MIILVPSINAFPLIIRLLLTVTKDDSVPNSIASELIVVVQGFRFEVVVTVKSPIIESENDSLVLISFLLYCVIKLLLYVSCN